MSYQGSSQDVNLAMVIEIIGGYLGFLGMGHIYAGLVSQGLLMLFGWWALIIAMVFIVLR